MNDPNHTASLLQQELENERNMREEAERANKALVEEFSKANTQDEVLEVAQKGIKDLLPTAIKTMRDLLNHSDSDSVKAGLSKYITDTVLTHKIEGEGNSEIKELLKQLQDNDNKPQPAAAPVNEGSGGNPIW